MPATLPIQAPSDTSFEPDLRRLLPPEWNVVHNGIWLHCTAPKQPRSRREADWKLHLSVLPRRAVELLNVVVPILVRHDCPFKCCHTEMALKGLNGKNWTRGGSGKFMTVYPASIEEIRLIAKELDEATRDFTGPYILSDRRYGNSRVVSYRFGGFVRRLQTAVTGEQYHVIPAPDGSWYRDERLPYYAPPPWAVDPFDAPESAPATPELCAGRFLMESALVFKNSGGVYLAVDRSTGKTVVVKEARNHVHVAEPDLDAQTLLTKEARFLQQLSGTATAPEYIHLFDEWDHLFLAQEYVAGMPLHMHSARFCKSLVGNCDSDTLFGSIDAMRGVFLDLCRVLRILHDEGIAYGDLSPFNVLILPDGTVRLIDFETSCQIGIDQPVPLRTPGFAPVKEMCASVTSDLYGVGALILQWFIPVMPASVLDAELPMRALSRLQEKLPLPEPLINIIRSLLDLDETKRPGLEAVEDALIALQPLSPPVSSVVKLTRPASNLKSVANDLAAGIRNRFDFAHPTRLAPGDRRGQTMHPLNLAFGAGGILGCLKRIAPEALDSQVEAWVSARADEVRPDTAAPGYLCGMAGIAASLLTSGYEEHAKRILNGSLAHPLRDQRPGLFFGSAGLICAQLQFFEYLRDKSHVDHAIAIAEDLLTRGVTDERGIHWQEDNGIPLGFGHGSSGIALSLLYLFAATRDKRYLEAGRRALAFDLAAAETSDTEFVTWRSHLGGAPIYYPYIERGTAGVGATLARYYYVTSDPIYLDLLKQIQRTRLNFTILPGYLNGLSGRGHLLADIALFAPELTDDEQMMDVIAGIELTLVKGAKGLCTPGDDVWQVSCDYGTGASGIMSLIDRHLTGATMPFLPDLLLLQGIETQ